jgi:hypothetical protein
VNPAADWLRQISSRWAGDPVRAMAQEVACDGLGHRYSGVDPRHAWFIETQSSRAPQCQRMTREDGEAHCNAERVHFERAHVEHGRREIRNHFIFAGKTTSPMLPA